MDLSLGYQLLRDGGRRGCADIEDGEVVAAMAGGEHSIERCGREGRGDAERRGREERAALTEAEGAMAPDVAEERMAPGVAGGRRGSVGRGGGEE